MDEGVFWAKLEYRLCHEFRGLAERRYRYFWCDGIEPEEYLLDGPSPRITGRADIYNGPELGWSWTFTLILPAWVRSRHEIDWASLLPAKNVTRWMSFDESAQTIEFDPLAAVPDLL